MAYDRVVLDAHANDNRPLVVGFAVAVGLHLFIGVPVIARSFGIGDPTAMFTHSDARDEAERRRKERLAQALQEHQENPPDPNEIPELIPGLEDGSETSMAWIGADEYQEHMARLGEVDQGGFRIKDSGGGARSPGPPQQGPDAPPGPPEQPQPMAAPVQPPPELAREPQAAPPEAAQPQPPEPPQQPTPPQPPAPPQQPAPSQQAPAPDSPTAQPSAPPIEAVRPATPVMPPQPAETPGTVRPTTEPPPTEVPSGSDLPPAEPDPSGTAPKPLERPRTADPTPQPAPAAPVDPARTPEPVPRDTPPEQPPQAAAQPSPSEPSPPPQVQQPPAPAQQQQQPQQQSPQQQNPAQAQVPPAPQAPPGAGGASTPAPTGVIGPGDGAGRPDSGQRSDRESDATSVINVPPEKWRTGAPIAHKGVEILTRRPELPILTRLTTRPLHPVADLFFDNQGKPVSVKIVQSSGYPDDIDQPVIDALYRWRAKGSQLARLPEGKVARFRVRVILD